MAGLYDYLKRSRKSSIKVNSLIMIKNFNNLGIKSNFLNWIG